jgi:hypothetical protein
MKNVIFPYPTVRGEPELSLSEVRVDGQLFGANAVAANERQLQLYGLDTTDWQKLSFQLDVQMPPAPLRAFEDEHGATALTVVVMCRPTNSRQTIQLERSTLDPSHWGGSVELQRSGFRGRATMQPILTAKVLGIPCRPVSEGDEWSLYFDPSESFRTGGALRVVWCDFKSEAAPAIGRQFPDVPYAVDLEKTLPEIYLNSSFEGLEPILRDSKDRTPVEQALHDSTRMAIARSVWMALLYDAMAAVQPGEDGEEPSWPEREWHADVLKHILPKIVESKSDSEILRLAATEWRSNPGSSTFMSRAEVIIGELIGANKALRKSTQTLIRKGIVS